MNRLRESTSPYLQQHADNPVDWWTWSDEAFAEARRRDVPVFLSVGYSACHWCHVMAHESFEDDGIAEYLNEHFVSIKVDREERPDVDAVYMEATVAMTGQGGWPMSCFLTPSGEPFYCGTYFPRDTFRQVLEALVNAWQTRRDEVGGIATSVVEQLTARRSISYAASGPPSGQNASSGGPSSGQGGSSGLGIQPRREGVYGEAVLEGAVAGLARDFDVRDAGFGGAPKFPPSMVLDFLLRHHRRTGSQQALSMVEQTAGRMARGGMYDQLAGGFARYSVDAQWVVPHFEKMLYDNALLLDVYTQWWAVAGNPLARRIATETADFLLAEMRTEEGGFASALDADSEGVEGKFYVWTPAELEEVLGPTDAAWAIELFHVTGTFEHGTSVLQLPHDPEDPERWGRVRGRLLEARGRRVRPGRDDKVVAAWNGLAVTALTRAGVVFDNPAYIDAAVRAAELIRDVHIDEEGRLHRTSRDGRPGEARGVLEDYGAVANACLVLLAVTGDASWYELAGRLLDRVLTNFVAEGPLRGSGGRPPEDTFYDADAETDDLIWRPTDPTDNASPSGVSLAAEALTTYAAVSGSEHHRTAAEQALAETAGLAHRAPRFAGRGLAVGETVMAGPLEIAVVGGPAERFELVRTAVRDSPWGTAVVAGEPGLQVPLMESRERVNGSPAAYVCQGFTCKLPVTTPDALREQLGR